MSSAVEYPTGHDDAVDYADEDFEDDFESETSSSAKPTSDKPGGGNSKPQSRSHSPASSASSGMPWDRASSHNNSAASEGREEHSTQSHTKLTTGADDAAVTSPTTASSRYLSSAPPHSHHPYNSSERNSASHHSVNDMPVSAAAITATEVEQGPRSPLSSSRSSSRSSSSSSSTVSSRKSSSHHSHHYEGEEEERETMTRGAADHQAAAAAAGEPYEGTTTTAAAAAASSTKAPSSHRKSATARRANGRSEAPASRHTEEEYGDGYGGSARLGHGRSVRSNGVEPARVPRTEQELLDMQRKNDDLREDIYRRQRELYHSSLLANKAETRRSMSKKETAAQHVRDAVLLERAKQMMRREQKELTQQKALLQKEVSKHRRALKYRTLVEETKEAILVLQEENHDLCLEMRCNEKLLMMNANVMESGQGAKQLQEEVRSRSALLERQAVHALRDADVAERQRDTLRDRVQMLQEKVDERRGAASSENYNDLQNEREDNRDLTRRLRELKAKVDKLQASLGRGDTTPTRAATTPSGGGTHTHSTKLDAEKEYLTERVEHMRRELARAKEARRTTEQQQQLATEKDNTYAATSRKTSASSRGTGAPEAVGRYQESEDDEDGMYPTTTTTALAHSAVEEVGPRTDGNTDDVGLWLDADAVSASHSHHSSTGAASSSHDVSRVAHEPTTTEMAAESHNNSHNSNNSNNDMYKASTFEPSMMVGEQASSPAWLDEPEQGTALGEAEDPTEDEAVASVEDDAGVPVEEEDEAGDPVKDEEEEDDTPDWLKF